MKSIITNLLEPYCVVIFCMGTFQVRLANGNRVNEGRVELYRYGYGWGTVCDDGWGEEEATVVCGMLGYHYGVAYGNAKFGPGEGEIFIDDIRCLGTEVSLWDCSRSYWSDHLCSHREDAGVRCGKFFNMMYRHDCNYYWLYHRLTAECDQHNCATLPLGHLGKSVLSRKKAGRERSFKYCQEPYIDIEIHFHQFWGETVVFAGWFHTTGSVFTSIKILDTIIPWWRHQI